MLLVERGERFRGRGKTVLLIKNIKKRERKFLIFDFFVCLFVYLLLTCPCTQEKGGRDSNF
jgi:hypothetical protein